MRPRSTGSARDRRSATAVTHPGVRLSFVPAFAADASSRRSVRVTKAHRSRVFRGPSRLRSTRALGRPAAATGHFSSARGWFVPPLAATPGSRCSLRATGCSLADAAGSSTNHSVRAFPIGTDSSCHMFSPITLRRKSHANKRRTRALQRTAPGGSACHAGCFRLRLSTPMQPARHAAPPSAVSELESLGVATRVVFNGAFLPAYLSPMPSSAYPDLAPRGGSRCPARHPISLVAVHS